MEPLKKLKLFMILWDGFYLILNFVILLCHLGYISILFLKIILKKLLSWNYSILCWKSVYFVGHIGSFLLFIYFFFIIKFNISNTIIQLLFNNDNKKKY